MTRTIGAAIGFVLIVLFLASIAIESTRANSAPRSTPFANR